MGIKRKTINKIIHLIRTEIDDRETSEWVVSVIKKARSTLNKSCLINFKENDEKEIKDRGESLIFKGSEIFIVDEKTKTAVNLLQSLQAYDQIED